MSFLLPVLFVVGGAGIDGEVVDVVLVGEQFLEGNEGEIFFGIEEADFILIFVGDDYVAIFLQIVLALL